MRNSGWMAIWIVAAASTLLAMPEVGAGADVADSNAAETRIMAAQGQVVSGDVEGALRTLREAEGDTGRQGHLRGQAGRSGNAR